MGRIEAGIIATLLAIVIVLGLVARHEYKLAGAQDCITQTITDANAGNEQVRQDQAKADARTIADLRTTVADLQAANRKAEAHDAAQRKADAAEAARRRYASEHDKATRDWRSVRIPTALLDSVREPASDNPDADGYADQMAPVPGPDDVHPPL